MTNVVGPFVVCCGMSRSASTWLYNVVLNLVPGSEGCYAEDLGAVPKMSKRIAVKCHGPNDNIIEYAQIHRLPVFFTVRDPRDVAVSSMDCFKTTFEQSVDSMAICSRRILKFISKCPGLLFRYEDGFAADLHTVEKIAEALGVHSETAITETFEAFSLSKVAAEVQRLEQDFFDPQGGPAQYHPRSHWHPQHIAGGQAGKYKERLTLEQQNTIMEEMKDYCQCFKYFNI